MTPDQLRQAYLDYFAERGHEVIPSAPLVPEEDPTTLFTGSGMQPLLPYFLGQTHPKGRRLTNSQQCFRSQDIEEVGDNRHTTFFEMLGNWSFGDYFKQEQLRWIFTFLVDKLNLDPERLYVTVYRGNDELDIPPDEEAVKLWQELFAERGIEAGVIEKVTESSLEKGRIFYSGQENWWSRVGSPAEMPVGEPGGPDSEIFYDCGPELRLHQDSEFTKQTCHPNCDCGRFLEIGNSVFMTYVRTAEGFKELANKNIDFGGGLERLLAALNGESDVFKTSLFQPIIQQLVELTGQPYGQDEQTTRAYRIIADHIKAAVMLAVAGVYPGNKEQGYFSRRLIRRALRYAQSIGLEKNMISQLVPVVAELYQQPYPEIKAQQSKIQEKFDQEERRFRRTLQRGLKEFEKLIDQTLTAEQAFRLYETYGFPLEMSLEEATQQQLKIEPQIEEKFAQEKERHAQESRQASQGKFKGGLKDQSETTTQYHTVTHLLLAALRKVLGTEVTQAGSNITSQRLRFDFNWPEALTDEQLNQVEEQINQWIEAELPVSKQTMSKKEALDSGAIATFIERYPDQVTVYTISQNSSDSWVSKEFCGGPHVENTAELEQIEIYKEKSSGSKTRRVYARFRE